MKKHLWTVCFSLALILFTVYISLDTFVIGRKYNTNAIEMNTSMFDNLEEPVETAKIEESEKTTFFSEKPASAEKPDNQEGRKASQQDRPEGSKRKDVSGETAQPMRPSVTQEPSITEDPYTAEDRDASDEKDEPAQDIAAEESGKTDNNQERGENSIRSTTSRNSSNNQSNNRFGWQNSRSAWGSNGQRSTDIYGSSGIDASAKYTGDTTYEDENIAIVLKEYTENNTAIYVAEVTVSSAQYLKTAFADNTYGKNVTDTTSSIAQANNAILAINGDYYGAQEKGYVIRNGIVYRNTARGTDVLCIYADGTMEIVSDQDYTAEELVGNNVWQAFSFGPSLIEDGDITVGESQGVGREMASNPRTAIGLISANHFLFVVSDGRTDASEGLSLYELAEFMQGLGVQTAYNLDGGGSSTMYFNGQVVNNPTSTGRIQERSVSDIVYIGENS